ncbi:MAG: hypothetical protein RLZZ86_1130 [Cyanobacteriota bacterium]|jgi:hypothetical protein
MQLNSQVGLIFAKCQDEISRLSSDCILTQTAQQRGNFLKFRSGDCFEHEKSNLGESIVSYSIFNLSSA